MLSHNSTFLKSRTAKHGSVIEILTLTTGVAFITLATLICSLIVGCSRQTYWERASQNKVLDAAQRGDRDAQFELGKRFYDGRRVTRDIGRGCDLTYSCLARRTRRRRALCMVQCGKRGWVLKKDEKQACVWLQKSAAQGNRIGQFDWRILSGRRRGEKDESEGVQVTAGPPIKALCSSGISLGNVHPRASGK